MKENPVPTKLSRVGNSAVIYIARELASLFDFQPGQTRLVKITPQSKPIEVNIRLFTNGALGVIIPKQALVDSGLMPVPTKKERDAGAKWDPPTLLVPFGSWELAKTTKRAAKSKSLAEHDAETVVRIKKANKSKKAPANTSASKTFMRAGA